MELVKDAHRYGIKTEWCEATFVDEINAATASITSDSVASSAGPVVSSSADAGAVPASSAGPVVSSSADAGAVPALKPEDTPAGQTQFDVAGGIWNPNVRTCGETGTVNAWCQREDATAADIGNFREKCKSWCIQIGHPVPDVSPDTIAGKTPFEVDGGTWNPAVRMCGETGIVNAWCQREDATAAHIGNFREKCKPWCKQIGHPVSEDPGKQHFEIGEGNWNPNVRTCEHTGKNLSWCNRRFTNKATETGSIGNFRDKCKPWCKEIGFPILPAEELMDKFSNPSFVISGERMKCGVVGTAFCKRVNESYAVDPLGTETVAGDFRQQCGPWCEFLGETLTGISSVGRGV